MYKYLRVSILLLIIVIAVMIAQNSNILTNLRVLILGQNANWIKDKNKPIIVNDVIDFIGKAMIAKLSI